MIKPHETGVMIFSKFRIDNLNNNRAELLKVAYVQQRKIINLNY